jgi:hypothetical protein
MKKLILFLKHGNPDRPLMRLELVGICSVLALIGAAGAAAGHFMATIEPSGPGVNGFYLWAALCLASALLLAGVEICAPDEDNVVLSRRVS